MDIDDKANRIAENAEFIRKNTPFQPSDAEWDDTEQWVLEAAQLAHDIMDLIKHFQDGGVRPRSWLSLVAAKSKMRDLIDVVRAMIELVPETEKEILPSLDDFRSSIEFAAPERMPFWWREIAEFLQESFPAPSNLEGWQQAIIDLWVDKERVGNK